MSKFTCTVIGMTQAIKCITELTINADSYGSVDVTASHNKQADHATRANMLEVLEYA